MIGGIFLVKMDSVRFSAALGQVPIHQSRSVYKPHLISHWHHSHWQWKAANYFSVTLLLSFRQPRTFSEGKRMRWGFSLVKFGCNNVSLGTFHCYKTTEYVRRVAKDHVQNKWLLNSLVFMLREVSDVFKSSSRWSWLSFNAPLRDHVSQDIL